MPVVFPGEGEYEFVLVANGDDSGRQSFRARLET